MDYVIVMTAENNKNESNANPHIKPAELKKKIDSGEDIFILDVRNPEEHKSWKVSYDRYRDTPVIPIDALSSPEMLKQIPKDKQVVTFCGHGNRSMSAAKILSEKGYDARSIEGGLDGWNSVYDVASITDVNSSVKIWQIRRVSKGCMSYMIASLSDKKVVVIDATCEIDNNAINTILDKNDFKIITVIDTHMHADHLSGATKLAQRHGSEVYVSSLEAYEIKNGHDDDDLNVKLIEGGDRIAVGDGIVLEAIHTPGHTNGSMCFKLRVKDVTKKTDNGYESVRNNNTHHIYLFTGDTLFVDGIGRPDLHNKAEESTRKLYNSYQQKILNLPDETLILPAHFSDSFEHSKPIFSTIKSVKEGMGLLSVPEDKFVRFVIASIPPQPTNYEKIISINKRMTSCDLIEQNDIEAGPNSCGIKA
jgi:glyoxylase-like metal-dependent hydrolase (beta-lactamase superfamily II)/rhodanese-related sulfurtransferase